MIVEINANDATGSSGLTAKDRRRAWSSDRWSWPQTWQKWATSGSSAPQRGQVNASLLLFPDFRPTPVRASPSRRLPACSMARAQRVCHHGFVRSGQSRSICGRSSVTDPELSSTRSAAASRCSRVAWAASRASISASSSWSRARSRRRWIGRLDVDHHAQVELVLLPGLHQQRDDVHDDGAGIGGGLELGGPGPDGGVHDGLQVAPGGRVGEHDASQRRTVEPARHRSAPWCRTAPRPRPAPAYPAPPPRGPARRRR